MGFYTRIISSQKLILSILLIITAVIYYPALNSRFILDDNVNLERLNLIDTDGYNYYIFSGISGITGRPLSLATFAWQHDDWPDNPFPFKAINLLLHLLNGLLVYLLSRLLSRQLSQNEMEITAMSLFATALWLLHPIQIYTVLYTIQRMTQLSALFVLIGLIGYLYSRTILAKRDERLALAGMSLCTGGGMVLGILAKENAILLPVFILVIETTLLSGSARIRTWTLWAGIFLLLPLLLLIIYFVCTFDDVLLSYSNRAFTPSERVLTQSLILFDYLKSLLFPHPSMFALYHDDYIFSAGIFSPPRTLAAVAGICGLVILGCICRKRLSVVSFAIFWFLGGHALEASHLNLELYFEHRNYLPAYGIFFLLAWLGALTWRKLASKVMTGLFLVVYSFMVLFVTRTEIKLWADPFLQATEWARIHPDSARAMENLGSSYLLLGQYDKAMETYHRIRKFYPYEIYPYIRNINVNSCMQGKQLSGTEWQEVLEQAESAKWYWLGTIAEIEQIVRMIANGRCDIADATYLIVLIRILADNPEYKRYHDKLYDLAATLAIYMRDADFALENIDKAIEHSPTVPRKIFKLQILFGLNKVEEAKQLLSEIRHSLRFDPRMLLAHKDELRSIEEKYQQELK